MESDKKPTPPADKPIASPAPADAPGANAARVEEVPGSPPVTQAGTPPVRSEVPSGAPPAARLAPGAAKASTTPTATTAKGIPKPVAARQSPTTLVETAPDAPVNKMRRRIVWASVVGFVAAIAMATIRFFLPRSIFEPSSVFRIGFPGDYALGVDTKYQQQYRIWVVRNTERLFVIYARCTHLGCTPDWKASENKFKCPCHGSGYDSEGINFEGPAPRPMDRAALDLDAEGQIVVNTGKLYDWQKGGTNRFDEPGSFIQV
ncbi:MAG TPA: Rieske 2Fe-2S domain-containing protein [Pyrinomonadaceae bacterium]|nr:Rieske 2Fe-2S domain-containing protein [Pyrinomonadaceae bacterium]